MASKEILLYSDYKSPYAYLAKDPAYELERDFDVRLRWLPYTLDIPSYLGSLEARTPHQWRRVYYSYMDGRRLANKRGLIVRAPQKIFDTSIANIGMLYAQRQGIFRTYHDAVFFRFWRRELDLENPEVIRSVLAESGSDAEDFFTFLYGEGRREHERIRSEAEEMGVFGVPTFVLDGELFWGGDRIGLLREQLDALGVRAETSTDAR